MHGAFSASDISAVGTVVGIVRTGRAIADDLPEIVDVASTGRERRIDRHPGRSAAEPSERSRIDIEVVVDREAGDFAPVVDGRRKRPEGRRAGQRPKVHEMTVPPDECTP